MRRQSRDCIYLHTDRGAALADFICSRYGLEVPLSFSMPKVEQLPDTNQGRPAHHRAPYYNEGGTAWPARLWVRNSSESALISSS